MSVYPARAHVSIIFATLIAFAGLASVLADSPKVTAVLSNSEPALGQTVELEIKVTGVNNATAPEEISVDGLEIHSTGTSRQFEMRNFAVTSSVTYNYTILPLKAGAFKIPPQTIRVGSNSLQTPELTLHVTGSTSRGNQTTRNATSNVDTQKLAWADVTIPQKEAYVGEIVPAEIRIGIDARARVDMQAIAAGPELKSEGFTARKWERPEQITQIANGRRERVFIYKTAIAAAKSGHFEIPAELKITMQWPERASQRRSPFDVFGMDDSIFQDPFAQYTAPSQVTIRSEPAILEVKPLPPNAPRNFSGAVGNFTMTTDANPKSLQVGDPITVTSTISGRGNFDRMNAPSLEDERGWHKYPPSSKFKKDDDVGMSGSKTFEMVVSPNEKKQALPPFLFSYFDPIKENYVTLRSDAFPLHVEGGSVTPAPSAVAPQPAPATPPTIAAKSSPKPQDILYQLTEPGPMESFSPLYMRSAFWLGQIVPLMALFGFVGWKIRQARIDNREARRIATLQQESTALLHRLRRSELTPEQYFSDASRAVRVKTALAKNVDPNTVDAEIAAAVFALDDHSREQLRRLFERSDEFRYSGRPNGAGTTSPEDRQEVLELIEGLHT